MRRREWFRRAALVLCVVLALLLAIGPIAFAQESEASTADPYPLKEEVEVRLDFARSQSEDLEELLAAAEEDLADARGDLAAARSTREGLAADLEQAETQVQTTMAALGAALRDGTASAELRADRREALQRRARLAAEHRGAQDAVADRRADVQAADDLLQLHEAMVAHNMITVAELEAQVADWSAYIDSLRNVQPKAQPPADLVQYGNGQIPPGALELIGVGHHRLWGPAATAYKALVAAAESDGIDIGITDSYRTYEVQVDLVLRKGLYSEGGLAARPGTSRHGWGLAVDLVLDDEALAWMRANAADYGWVETTPREPWHWEFTARQ